MSYFGGFARPGEPDPFNPYRYQREFMEYLSTHSRSKPARAYAVWPRRHGKDMTALFQLAEKAHDEPGMYWHGLPTYEQARKAVWMAFRNDTGKRLMDSVFPREVIRRPVNGEWAPNSEMLVELHNGSIIQFVGSDTVDSLVGAGIKGLNASEFSLWKPSAYHYIRPMLRESGGWAAFLFTPRGRNHAFEAVERAKKLGQFVSHLNIFTAGRYTEEEAKAILREELAEGMLEELVKQEYLCDFSAALVGSYWGDLIADVEARGDLATFFEYEGEPVFVTWDLGYSDMTAMWAWSCVNGKFTVHAHYENHNKPLSHYFSKLDEWAADPKDGGLGLRFEAMQLPHDALQHTLQTGMTIVDQFIERFRGTKVSIDVVPKVDPIDGIQAVRLLLQQPIRFHPRCAKHDGVEALRQYHRKYDEDKRVFALTADHDWSSHSADAFRYVAVMAKYVLGLMEGRRPKPQPRRELQPSQPVDMTGRGAGDLPTLDKLFADNESINPSWRRA